MLKVEYKNMVDVGEYVANLDTRSKQAVGEKQGSFVFANEYQNVYQRAYEVGGEKLQELQRTGKFLRRVQLHLGEQGFRRRFAEQAANEMIANNNVNCAFEIVKSKNRFRRILSPGKVQATIAAGADYMRAEHELSEQGKTSQIMEQVSSKISLQGQQLGKDIISLDISKLGARRKIRDELITKIIQPYLRGDLADGLPLQKALKKYVDENRGDSDIDAIFPPGEKVDYSMFATNIKLAAEQQKEYNTLHKRDLDAIDDQTEIIIANPKWRARTERYRNWADKAVDFAQDRGGAYGLLLNQWTVGLVAYGGVMGVSYLAKTQIHNPVGYLLGSVATGAATGIRKYVELKRDRADVGIQKAYNKTPAGPNVTAKTIEAKEKTPLPICSARDLIYGDGAQRKEFAELVNMDNLSSKRSDDTTNLNAAVNRGNLYERIAEITARLDWSDINKRDLISHDNEWVFNQKDAPLTLAIAIGRARLLEVLIKEGTEEGEAQSLINTEIQARYNTYMKSFTSTKEQQDSAFRSYALRESAKAGLVGFAQSLALGAIFQEAGALGERAIGINTPQTMLEGFGSKVGNTAANLLHLGQSSGVGIPHEALATLFQHGGNIDINGLNAHVTAGTHAVTFADYKGTQPPMHIDAKGNLVTDGNLSKYPGFEKMLEAHGFTPAGAPTTESLGAVVTNHDLPFQTDVPKNTAWVSDGHGGFNLIDKTNPSHILVADAKFSPDGHMISHGAVDTKAVQLGGETSGGTMVIEPQKLLDQYSTQVEWQWYANDTNYSDFNELKFYNQRIGPHAVEFNIQSMTNSGSWESGLNPFKPSVHDLINQGKVDFAFWNPNDPNHALIVRDLSHPGTLDLDQTNWTHMVEVYQNGQWVKVPEASVANIVMGQNLGDFTHASDLTGHQNIFNFKCSAVDMTADNGKTVMQSFATIDGTGSLPSKIDIPTNITHVTSVSHTLTPFHVSGQQPPTGRTATTPVPFDWPFPGPAGYPRNPLGEFQAGKVKLPPQPPKNEPRLPVTPPVLPQEKDPVLAPGIDKAEDPVLAQGNNPNLDRREGDPILGPGRDEFGDPILGQGSNNPDLDRKEGDPLQGPGLDEFGDPILGPGLDKYGDPVLGGGMTGRNTIEPKSVPTSKLPVKKLEEAVKSNNLLDENGQIPTTQSSNETLSPEQIRQKNFNLFLREAERRENSEINDQEIEDKTKKLEEIYNATVNKDDFWSLMNSSLAISQRDKWLKPSNEALDAGRINLAIRVAERVRENAQREKYESEFIPALQIASYTILEKLREDGIFNKTAQEAEREIANNIINKPDSEQLLYRIGWHVLQSTAKTNPNLQNNALEEEITKKICDSVRNNLKRIVGETNWTGQLQEVNIPSLSTSGGEWNLLPILIGKNEIGERGENAPSTKTAVGNQVSLMFMASKTAASQGQKTISLQVETALPQLDEASEAEYRKMIRALSGAYGSEQTITDANAKVDEISVRDSKVGIHNIDFSLYESGTELGEKAILDFMFRFSRGNRETPLQVYAQQEYGKLMRDLENLNGEYGIDYQGLTKKAGENWQSIAWEEMAAAIRKNPELRRRYAEIISGYTDNMRKKYEELPQSEFDKRIAQLEAFIGTSESAERLRRSGVRYLTSDPLDIIYNGDASIIHLSDQQRVAMGINYGDEVNLEINGKKGKVRVERKNERWDGTIKGEDHDFPYIRVSPKVISEYQMSLDVPVTQFADSNERTIRLETASSKDKDVILMQEARGFQIEGDPMSTEEEIYFNQDDLDKLGVNENETIYVRFGKLSRQVKIAKSNKQISADAASPNTWQVSSRLLRQFGLEKVNDAIRIRGGFDKKNRILRLGPSLAYYGYYNENQPGLGTSQFQELAKYGRELGVGVFFIDPRPAKSGERFRQTEEIINQNFVNAMVYNPDTKNWNHVTIPIPDVLYNIHLDQEETEVSKLLSNSFNNNTINSYEVNTLSANKLPVSQIMKSEMILADYQPDTIHLDLDLQNLESFLQKHENLILKPTHSSGGAGIIQVTKTGDEYTIRLNGQDKQIPANAQDLYREVHDLISTHKLGDETGYIIQERINFDEYQDNGAIKHIEPRVIVQDGLTGPEVTGILARVYCQGGGYSWIEIQNPWDALRKLYPNDEERVKRVLKELQDVSLATLKLFKNNLPAESRVRELAIDLGVSKEGIKLIEVNGTGGVYGYLQAPNTGLSDAGRNFMTRPLEAALEMKKIVQS